MDQSFKGEAAYQPPDMVETMEWCCLSQRASKEGKLRAAESETFVQQPSPHQDVVLTSGPISPSAWSVTPLLAQTRGQKEPQWTRRRTSGPAFGGPALEWVLAVEFALENRASKQKI